MILIMEKKRTYIAIDLKSFYASVECQERGLDPLRTNLVVADVSKTEKTICLAVTPALKAYGISGRARLFEVNQKVDAINRERAKNIHYKPFVASSIYADELQNPYIQLEYLAAPPRMATYIEYSTRIYAIYLRYIAKEDIHPYSIDEVFIDATDYLKLYQVSAHDFARQLIQEVLKETGITATAGIGENLFLCKCAMDIVAKHIPADKDGVRIAQLDMYAFRKQLWTHEPLTDFWRIGKGIAKKLNQEGIFTMGDIARCSIGSFYDYYNEDLLYRLFGVNAELLIDHAWGYEPCTMQDIKAYQPTVHSLGIGQVLSRPYTYEEGLTILKEMVEQLSLKLVKNNKDASGIQLMIGYDIDSLDEAYTGEISVDWYGRTLPKAMHASISFPVRTNSAVQIKEKALHVYEEKVSKNLLIRRINIAGIDVQDETQHSYYVQQDLFSPPKEIQLEDPSEKKAQQAILEIQRRYGKNAVVKVMDLQKEATTKERNEQIGGHKA